MEWFSTTYFSNFEDYARLPILYNFKEVNSKKSTISIFLKFCSSMKNCSFVRSCPPGISKTGTRSWTTNSGFTEQKSSSWYSWKKCVWKKSSIIIMKISVVDPDPHRSRTFAWIRIRNYCSGSSKKIKRI